jgi:hypothetical protein
MATLTSDIGNGEEQVVCKSDTIVSVFRRGSSCLF